MTSCWDGAVQLSSKILKLFSPKLTKSWITYVASELFRNWERKRVAKQYFTHSLSSFLKYCFCHEKIKFISWSHRVMFFSLYRQKDIDKIIDFYSPKSNCDGSKLQYSNMTLVTIILRNNTELNRALQWQNISKALKNVEVKFKRRKTPTNFEGKLPKLRHR